MKFNRKSINTKVARRIFLLFILCSLLPITALGLVSYIQVKGELEKQGQRRLHEESKNLGEAVSERLTHIENDFYTFSLIHDFNPDMVNLKLGQKHLDQLKRRIKALSFIDASNKAFPFFGKILPPPEISAAEQEHLNSGRALVQVFSEDNNPCIIYMLKLLDPKQPARGMLYGVINGMYLWGLDEFNTLPAFTQLAVLDKTCNIIFSTHESFPDFSRYKAFHEPRSSISSIGWEYQGQQYQAGFRSVFMEYNWFYQRLILVMSAPKDYIFAPIKYFKILFPLVTFLAILIVLLLSAIQIRRVTQPIEELKKGSRRIAGQDFDVGVEIKSGDEFEELGKAFDEMAKQLKSQFHALRTMSEISRAILSSLNTKEIIDFLIYGIKDYFEYDLVNVSLFYPNDQEQAWIYSGNDKISGSTIRKIVRLPVDKVKEYIGKQHIKSFRVHDNLPDYLTPILDDGIKAVTLLPLFIKQKMSGIIILGTKNSKNFSKVTLDQARQLADQVAVAISNARLLEELEDLNWGTLYALARTVDAKSRWTGNHSERVAEMSLKIGRVMGLSEEELNSLRRAALLHDIGKVGIPLHILDKNGELSELERQTIHEHPVTGARILEPISAYAPVIPIVLQHHERFDGTGYPKGLSGKAITLGARILAVADVYDALTSDRPYRSAIEPRQILDKMYKESGEKFDPRVLDALKIVMTSSKRRSITRPKREFIRGLRIEA